MKSDVLAYITEVPTLTDPWLQIGNSSEQEFHLTLCPRLVFQKLWCWWVCAESELFINLSSRHCLHSSELLSCLFIIVVALLFGIS